MAAPEPPRPAPVPAGVSDDTWMDVIHKMDEVYSQLLRDEVALEQKNTELEASQQFIYGLLSSMSDVLVAADAQGRIEQTNQALCELVGNAEEALLGVPMDGLLYDAPGIAALHDMMHRAITLRQGHSVELMLRDAAGGLYRHAALRRPQALHWICVCGPPHGRDQTRLPPVA